MAKIADLQRGVVFSFQDGLPRFFNPNLCGNLFVVTDYGRSVQCIQRLQPAYDTTDRNIGIYSLQDLEVVEQVITATEPKKEVTKHLTVHDSDFIF